MTNVGTSGLQVEGSRSDVRGGSVGVEGGIVVEGGDPEIFRTLLGQELSRVRVMLREAKRAYERALAEVTLYTYLEGVLEKEVEIHRVV